MKIRVIDLQHWIQSNLDNKTLKPESFVTCLNPDDDSLFYIDTLSWLSNGSIMFSQEENHGD